MSSLILSGPKKNHIINGGFDLWQRGTSGDGLAYVADRWRTLNTAATATQAQSTDVPPNNVSNFSHLMTVTTGAAKAAGDIQFLRYIMEGNDLLAFKGKTMTFSFWVKSSLAGQYSVGIVNFGAFDKSYIMPYTINSANTWEYKTLTFTHDPTGSWNYDNNQGMEIRFNYGIQGSDFLTSTTNQWIVGNKVGFSGDVDLTATTGATMQFAQIMLNEGSIAAPFRRAGNTITGELALCQRYYERGNTSFRIGANAAITLNISLEFATVKRATPTFVASIGGTPNILVVHDNISDPTKPVDSYVSTGNGMRVVYNGLSSGGLIPNQGGTFDWTADAEF